MNGNILDGVLSKMSDFMSRMFRNNIMPKWPPIKIQQELDIDAEEAKVEDLSRDEWRRKIVEKLLKGDS